MYVKAPFLLITCLCLCFAVSVFASTDEKTVLSGILLDDAGEGISGAEIIIVTKAESRPLAEALTDDSGKFFIPLSRSGTIIIRFNYDNAEHDLVCSLYSHRQNYFQLRFNAQKKQLSYDLDPFTSIYLTGPEQVESIDKEFIGKLPLQNDPDEIISLFSFAKGGDSSNIQGYGAGTTLHVLDTVDITNPFDGSRGATVPFDAVDQYSVFLTDKPQVFSGNKGPVISINTVEPGGNAVFAASFFYETSDFPEQIDALQFSKERSLFVPTVMHGNYFGRNISYFGAISYKTEDFSATPVRVASIETRTPVIFAKARYAIDSSLRIRGHYLGNFDTHNNFAAPDSDLFEIRSSGTTTSDFTLNRHSLSLGVEKDFSTLWISSGISFYRDSITLEPSDGNRDRSSVIDPLAEVPILIDGSIEDRFSDDEHEQLSLDASVTFPQLSFIGHHSLDFALHYQQADMQLSQGFNGGYRFDFSDTLGRPFRRISIIQNGKDFFTDERNIDRFQLSFSDEWRIIPTFMTLNAGLTWDKTQGENDQAEIYDWSTVSPHIAVTIDPFRNNFLLLNIGYSRNYLKLLGLHIPGSPYTLKTDFYDAATNSYETSALNGEEIIGYQPDRVDSDIKRPFVDEFSLGLNANLSQNTAISTTMKYWREEDIFEDIEQNLWPRYLERQTEDIRDQEYSYFILRPGRDGTLNPFLFLTNIDLLKREYFGFDFSFRTRPTQNLMIFGHYTWSRLEGNIGNGPDDISGRTGVYNDPNERLNSRGFLADDVRHALNLAITYTAPGGVHMSSIVRYDSGRPLDRLLLNPDAGRYSIRADARGTVYREQSTTTIDVRAEKSIRILENQSFTFIFDVFNLTDDDTPVLYDTRDLYFPMPLAARDPRRFQWGVKYRY